MSVVRAPTGQLAQAQFTYAPLTFAFTGALQRFTVPAGVSSVSVQVWGAAGGAGDKSGIRGGAGGYASGTLSVDAGQVFTVVVGQGGARWFGLSLDGGVVDAGSGAGAGGGLSGFFDTMADGGISAATALVIAGGGGGGGFFANVPFGSSGGNGGGAFGGAGAVTGQRSRSAAQPRQAQPARNATPPIGVIMPRPRIPVNASAYRLPLNSSVPSTNAAPAASSARVRNVRAPSATATSASAWTIW
jgi:hypothetical protein